MSELNDAGKREREEDDTYVEAPPSKATKSDNEPVEDGATAPEATSNGVSEESNTVEPSKQTDSEEKNEESVFVVDRKGEEAVDQKDEGEEETKEPEDQVPAPVTVTVSKDTASAPLPPSPKALPLPVPPVNPNIQPTVVNQDQIVEERGEIPALYVGKVIGKGGEMIRDLQARSAARIDVDQNVPPGLPRGITYRGTRKTVDFAKYLVSLLQQENVSENDLPLGQASRRFVVIPAQAVGKIIGRGGEMIRELQNKSQAKIQIDHSGSTGLPPDKKQVSITGSEQAVVKGEEMINFLVANPLMEGLQAIAMLVEEKVKSGSQWGSGPPYMGLPNHGMNMQPNSGAAFGQQSFTSGGYGGGHVPPAMPNTYGNPSLPPSQPSFGGSLPSFGGAAGLGQEVSILYVQKQFMGRIIGKKGVTINDLQRRSSCDIQVNQNVPPGQDCEITIRGAPQGIEMAKHMIREIIEIGPQHPYAGGAESGGMAFQQQGYGQSYGGQQGSYGASYGGGYQAQQSYGQGSYQQTPSFSQNAPTYGAAPISFPAAQVQLPPAYSQPPVPAPQYGYGQIQAPVVSEWKSATSADGQVYYYNERTGATQWEKPAGML